jgi:hypothetical protein
MRNVVLAALMVSSLAPLHDAAACGVPEPVVYRLSSHEPIDHDQTNDHRRTFALLAERASAPFAKPAMLTLVGPSRTRVVSTKRHVVLSGGTGAIEVPAIGDYEHFEIALSGAHGDAKWHALVGTEKSNTYRAANVEVIMHRVKDSTKVITYVRHGSTSLGRFDGHALGAFELDGLTKLVIADGANVRTLAI